MNNVNLSGWISTVPEYGQTKSGGSFLNFSIGVYDTRRKYDKKNKTTFINCVVYNKKADLAVKMLGKGDFVVIENAELIVQNYTDNAGKKIYVYKVNVYKFFRPASMKLESDAQEKTTAEALNSLHNSDDNEEPGEPF